MILQQPGRTNFDLNFRLLRIPVRVHPGFWILSVLFSIQDRLPILFVVCGVSLVFVSILVHEFGHALSSRFLGERRNSVILYAMGGLCVHEQARANPMQRIWTLLWGPFAGFVLGGGVLVFWLLMNAKILPQSDLLDYILVNGMLINFGWGIMNLFPIFPLDGGQILREFLRWKSSRGSDAFVCTVSMWTGGILAALLVAAHFVTAALHFWIQISLFPALLFGLLAVQNYFFRKQILAMGADYGNEEEPPRQPWEQDPDWWKK